jgi:Spirocyclase AveC-like
MNQRAPLPHPPLIAPLPARASNATPFWIVMGAAWFALFVYCMAAWVLGPDFVPNTFGRDQASPAYVRFIRTMEVLMVALTVWLLYYFVFKPRLRDGKLSFDGLFFLACFTLVLQEPWHARIRPQLLYNSIFINYGSWMGTLPVSNPTAYKTPLPIAFAGLGYFWIVAGPAWCGSRWMSRVRAHNSTLSNAKMVFLCFLGFCVFDLIIESFIHRTGMFIFPSTIPWLTLFAGKSYQFPLYETVSWAGTYTTLACIHHFRNDKGETWADRGFDTLRIPAPIAKFARWLALVGICHIGMFVTYNLPYMFWALHGGPFTVTEESHPWLTAGLCGPSTAYDCPGPGVPFARRDSPTNRVAPPAAAPLPSPAEEE